MVERLGRKTLTVSELADPYEISLPAVTKHIRVLERANLLEQKKHGNFRQCSLTRENYTQAFRWIEKQRNFWEKKLTQLKETLETI